MHTYFENNDVPDCKRQGDLNGHGQPDMRRCYHPSYPQCKRHCDNYVCTMNGKNLQPVFDTLDSIKSYTNYLTSQVETLYDFNNQGRNNMNKMARQQNLSLCLAYMDEKNNSYTKEEFQQIRYSIETIMNSFVSAPVWSKWMKSHVPVVLSKIVIRHEGIQYECPPGVICEVRFDEEQDPMNSGRNHCNEEEPDVIMIMSSGKTNNGGFYSIFFIIRMEFIF